MASSINLYTGMGRKPSLGAGRHGGGGRAVSEDVGVLFDEVH